VHKLSAHACSSICAFDWAARLSPVEVTRNDTSPHDTSGCAASANTVRGCSGSTVGPSGSHYIIGPLQKASGPRKKEKTAMSHFWDTHHIPTRNRKAIAAQLFLVSGSQNQVGSSISMARTKKGPLRLKSGVTSDFRCLMGHVVQPGLNMGIASHC